MNENMGRYILKDKVPVPCEDLLTWGRWLEKGENRLVRQEEVGDLLVSTMFMGLDHNWGFGPPLLFETMIFRRSNARDLAEMEECARQMKYEGKLTCPERICIGFQQRTSTWELALEAHEEAVVWAREQMH